MLEKGSMYKRSKIHDKYGGNRQSGITKSKKTNIIFIFTGISGKKYGYHDYWIDDVTFNYFGEGTTGDMEFTRGNKLLRDQIGSNKEIFLFEILEKPRGYVKFIDTMTVINYSEGEGEDENGTNRRIIEFQLLRSYSEKFEEDLSSYEEELSGETLEQLREKAKRSYIDSNSNTRERITKYYRSSIIVKKYALKRASGMCEACDSPAPFVKSNDEPYLEVHHMRKRSDNGPDSPENVIAICPNCHRRAHHSKDKKEFNNQLIEKTQKKELNFLN